MFQGARSIVSRFATTGKKDIPSHNAMESSSKKINNEANTFFDQARLCATREPVILTHSSIIEDPHKKGTMNEIISLDSIPMSPHTKTNLGYDHFKVGKLLGVGKWAHVYLCQ